MHQLGKAKYNFKYDLGVSFVILLLILTADDLSFPLLIILSVLVL